MAMLPIPILPFEIPLVVVLQTPSSGRREDGFKPSPTVPISELPREVVVQMCAEFTSRVLTRYDQDTRQQSREDEFLRTDR